MRRPVALRLSAALATTALSAATAAVLLMPGASAATAGATGYASQNGGTTGGAGGQTVRATTGTAIHTATHFGSPAGCAAALTVLEALTDERHAITKDVGARFAKVLEAKTVKHGVVIRQRGLMVGVDLKTSTRALSIMRALLARGYVVLTGGRGGEALTLTPPLDVPFELLEGFATALGEVLEKQS